MVLPDYKMFHILLIIAYNICTVSNGLYIVAFLIIYLKLFVQSFQSQVSDSVLVI